MFRCCFQRKNKNNMVAMEGPAVDTTTEAPDLKKAVQEQDWEETSRILKAHSEVAKSELSKDEFNILWNDAPLETIQALLEAWPEAYEMNDGWGMNLVEVKISRQQWDFLKSILPSCPNSVTTRMVHDACREDTKEYAPIDVYKLMLDQQPNAPLETPFFISRLIERNKLEHFLAVLDRCPAATDVKQDNTHLTPLLRMFQNKVRMNADWIGPILHLSPNAVKQKDFDGKMALHLAYQHGASSGLIDMIREAYPAAENERDKLGRIPKDLSNQSEKSVFTAANETLILWDYLNDEKKSYPDDAVVVHRDDMLIRDPLLPQNEEDWTIYFRYSEQVLARHGIFVTLLEEFSKMVRVDNKDVIQKAAALQVLAVQFLSNQSGSIVNFGSFGNPGYWFQQEVLKLVLRVYHETQCRLDSPFPSVPKDAQFCMDQLDGRKNGGPSPKPKDEHVKAYNELTQWLTEGFDDSSYTLQGPVLKPLQSLFNKLFIRRGQTSVHIIGDMVRGTLLLDNTTMLDEVVKRIEGKFPNITKNTFRHPDKCTGLADFLEYVHNDLNLLPNSDDVRPYRFKANSSQKKNKVKPLWFNLNFFLQIPEYHRVGFSEMFVACELQIGVEEEVNKHRSVHDAYERDRILSNQPLLKNYGAMKKGKDEDKSLQLSNCTEDDNKLIENVLFGKIATELLIPCTTPGDDNKCNVLLFENGLFRLSEDEVEAGSFVKPERLCLNNRSLNWFALDCPKKDKDEFICAACVVAGPYKLDETKRYFVESFALRNFHSSGFGGTVGLYAHVGPYSIQIACSRVWDDTRDVVVVKSGRNFSYLEQMCPVPVGTTALEVIIYGLFYKAAEFKYEEINLSLKVFDIL